MAIEIKSMKITDLRFPTSLGLHGSDAMVGSKNIHKYIL